MQNNAATSFTFEVFAYYSSAGPAGDRVSFQCTFKVCVVVVLLFTSGVLACFSPIILQSYLRVTVDVVDVNDPPRFADQQETIAVTEVSVSNY